MRTAAALAGLLGGLAWMAAYFLDNLDRARAAEAAGWAGLLLLAVAVLSAGAGLVSRSATWLRFLVAICFALLVWSVLEVLSNGVDQRLVHGATGLVAVVVAGLVLARRAPPGPRPQPRSAAHRAPGSRVR